MALHLNIRLIEVPATTDLALRPRRSSSATAGANFASRLRTASQVNTMSRIRNISARSRRLRLWRSHHSTTSAITSLGYWVRFNPHQLLERDIGINPQHKAVKLPYES